MDLDKTSKEELVKLLEQIRDQQDSRANFNANEIDENQKLFDSRHEIIFSITANVVEQDDTGQAVASRHICRKNYHIPVPATKDYNEYMTAFFDFLEKCLSDSANQANHIKDKIDG
jgi:maltose-binding protein MalE